MTESNISNKEERKEVILKETKAKMSSGNVWKTYTVVLAVVCIALIVLVFRGGITGNVVGGEDAAQNLLDYLGERADGEVTFVSSEDLGSLYLITVEFEGQDYPFHVTKDGKYFAQGIVPITEDEPIQQPPAAVEVPKTDKPKVELFIWSYCPYGVQAQEPFASAASLLKEEADLEVILYYDGHGEFETQQNQIQACIQEIDKDKYWEYAEGFVKDIYSKCGADRDKNCDKRESIKLMKAVGIDSTEVMKCVDDRGEELIAEHSSRAGAYGVTGSPSLVINGVTVNVARSAEAYKTAVCDAFNTAPLDCSETLDSSGAAAAGNC